MTTACSITKAYSLGLKAMPDPCSACAQSLTSCVQLLLTPCTVARQAPLSMRLFRQQYWSGLPFPSSGDLLNPGIEPASLGFHGVACKFFTIEPPRPSNLCISHKWKKMQWENAATRPGKRIRD